MYVCHNLSKNWENWEKMGNGEWKMGIGELGIGAMGIGEMENGGGNGNWRNGNGGNWGNWEFGNWGNENWGNGKLPYDIILEVETANWVTRWEVWK